MSDCEFVLIGLMNFELEAKTQIFDQISSQIRPLTPTGRGTFLEHIYKLVRRVKSFDCDNFCPHRTCRNERQAKT